MAVTAPFLLLVGLALGLVLANGLERDEPTRRARAATTTERPATTVVRTVTNEVTAEEQSTMSARWSVCVNPEAGYAIGYPAGWYTTHPDPAQACQLFDPDPIEVPAGTDFPPPALSVSQVPGNVDEYLENATNPMFWRTLSRTETTIVGLPAVRVETEFVATEGESERGTRSYGYVIDRDGRIVTVFATGLPGDDGYAHYKRVADKAAATLRFF